LAFRSGAFGLALSLGSPEAAARQPPRSLSGRVFNEPFGIPARLIRNNVNANLRNGAVVAVFE
jgi:hypothetical protein